MSEQVADPLPPQPPPTVGSAQDAVDVVEPVPEGAPASSTWVYAIGRIEPRFPSLATEKELAQATGRADAAGLTDRQALHAVLTDRANRYLARQLCWVLSIEGMET